jgi:uncharacterized membrane protein YeaQ/YmgE (transglycosylase-associated protein family)
MIGWILFAIIGGAIIGYLGKMVAPGDRDNIPLWLTIACGIGGVIIGNFVYAIIWHSGNTNYDGPGFDWWRHICKVVVAAVLVVLASGTSGRKKISA